MKALAPARVREVRIHPDTGTAEVIVPDFQLSLAIGKEGQNARLAARLTGWRVDIKSETQLAGRGGGRRRRVRRGRVGHQRHRRARVAAGRGWRGDLGRRGGVRGAGTAGDRRRRAEAGRPRRAEAPPRHGESARRSGRTAPRPSAPRPRRRGDAGDREPTAVPRRRPQPRGRGTRRSGGGRRLARRPPGPVRTCIGCRRVAGVEELVRIRATASGLELGAGPGRGAWLCRSDPAACLDEAQRRRAVERALRTPVRNDDIERLRARLVHGDQQRHWRNGRSV